MERGSEIALDVGDYSMIDWHGLDEEKDMISRIEEELDTYFGVGRYTLELIQKKPHEPALFVLHFHFRDARDIIAYAEIKPNMLTEPSDKYVIKVVSTLVEDAFDAIVEHWHFSSQLDMPLQEWMNMDTHQYDYWAKGGGKPNGWTFQRGTEDLR